MRPARSLSNRLEVEHALRCAKVLGVDLPTDATTLKKAFRVIARKCHPDVGGDAEDFKKAKDAFDFLVSSSVLSDGTRRTDTTREGDLLINLGHGLGPRKNGKSCDTCNGAGYTGGFQKNMYSTCYRCGGSGEIEMFNPCLPKWKLQTANKRQRPPKKKKPTSGRFVTAPYV